MEPRDPPVARLQQVSQSYGDVKALDGIDFCLRQGEVLALLAPNGAGKTTAVSILLGLLQPDRGRVEVWGSDPRALPVRAPRGYTSESSSP